MNYVFIGFKGVGKTTFGKMVAASKDMEFIDTDKLIEKIHEEEENEKLSFRQIYKKYGGEYFREIEEKTISYLMDKNGYVISLGGGAASNNPEEIKKLGKVVYLTEDAEVLYKRVLVKGIPAFLDKVNPKESFMSLYEKRMKIFESISDVEIDISGLSKGDAIKKILGELK